MKKYEFSWKRALYPNNLGEIWTLCPTLISLHETQLDQSLQSQGVPWGVPKIKKVSRFIPSRACGCVYRSGSTQKNFRSLEAFVFECHPFSYLQRNMVKNTKENLTFQFFACFSLFFLVLRVQYPIAQFVWSIRFFWYPYWHTLWQFMSYGICRKTS